MRHYGVGRREWLVAMAATAATASVSACKNNGGRGGKPLVVASVFPVYDLARRVGGDVVHVELLLEPGKGVHAYNPTTKDAKRVAGAKLAFIIGLELDEWTTKILEASGGGTPVIELGERVKAAKFDLKHVGGEHGEPTKGHDEHAEKHDDHDKGHDHSGHEEHTDEHSDHEKGHDEHDDHEKGHDEHADEHSDHEKGHDEHADEHGDHAKGHDEHADEHGDHAKGHDEHGDHDKGHSEHADEHGDHDKGHDEHADKPATHGGHAGHHHHPDDKDPHVWLSVPRAIAMAETMAEELGKVLPDHASTFQANLATLVEQLRVLDKEIRAQTTTFKKRGFVTFHGSFAYFAEEYALDIVAVIEPFPDKEPSAMYLKEVLETIRRNPVGALYTEPQLDPRPAQVLAQEAKLPLLVLDPVGGLEGRDSYETMMHFNLAALKESLG